MTSALDTEDRKMIAEMAKRLDIVAKACGLSGRGLSVEAGMAPATVNNMRNSGGQWMSLAKVMQAAERQGVRVNGHWLLTGKGKPLLAQAPETLSVAAEPVAPVAHDPDEVREAVVKVARHLAKVKPSKRTIEAVIANPPADLSDANILNAFQSAASSDGSSKKGKTRRAAEEKRAIDEAKAGAESVPAAAPSASVKKRSKSA